MLRQDFNRIDPKRRNVIDHRKKQFASPQYKDAEYRSRLNFYVEPPTADITLEQFEQWAIDRLRGNKSSGFSICQRSNSFYSSCRARSMLFQKQITSRNGDTHEAYSRQIPTSRL